MLALALREGLRNVRRQRALSLVLSGSIGLGLVLAAFLLTVGQTVTARLRAWESRVEVVAFVAAATSEDELRRIETDLGALPSVAGVAYTSPDQAWQEFITDAEAPADLASAGEVGLMPGAFTLGLRAGAVEVAELERVVAAAGAVPGVVDVEYAADLLSRYAALRRDVRRVTRLGLLLLLGILGGLSTGTIRLGLNARHAELRSWVWEGADPGFLNVVCATEAGLQGLLGSAWALCVFLVGEGFAMARWGLAPPGHWPLFGFILLLGPSLGVIASVLSTRRLLRGLSLGVLVMALGSPAWPAGADDSPAAPPAPVTTRDFEVQRLQGDLDRLREQRKLTLREAHRLSGESLSLLDEMEQIGIIEDTLHDQMQSLNVESGRLTVESTELERQIHVTEAEHQVRGRRAVALSRLLNRTPDNTLFAVLLADRPQGEAIRLRRAQQILVRHRLAAFADLERAQRVLREQRKALETSQAEAVELAADLEANLVAQAAARAEQRALLHAVQAEQAIAAATAAALESSMEELAELLAHLPAESDPATTLYGPVPFRELRGVLPWPVEEATVARGFGRQVAPVFHTVTQHDGWLLAPPESGAVVRAVHDGIVRYRGWLHGYGKLLILDHGGGYQTLYGHCAKLTVAPGQVVRAGELIGTVGTTGPLVGPGLYFAVRVQGIAEDPAGWLTGKKG